jgi:hypothetical protein
LKKLYDNSTEAEKDNYSLLPKIKPIFLPHDGLINFEEAK